MSERGDAVTEAHINLLASVKLSQGLVDWNNSYHLGAIEKAQLVRPPINFTRGAIRTCTPFSPAPFEFGSNIPGFGPSLNFYMERDDAVVAAWAKTGLTKQKPQLHSAGRVMEKHSLADGSSLAACESPVWLLETVLIPADLTVAIFQAPP